MVCFQDAPVMFPIFSLGGVTDADNRVTLDTDDGEILHKPTGEKDTMIKRYGVYWLKMIVDPSLLQPPNQPFPKARVP